MSIDHIPLPRTAGALWLCGRSDVGPDPERALARAGSASTVVCLNAVEELLVGFPGYVDWLRANDATRAIWFPIRNYAAPSPAALAPIIEQIVTRLERGESVLVHCAAGQGRAGTVAACVLVALGATPDDAVRTVASHRALAGPASGSQWALVDGIAAALAHGSGDAGAVG